MAEFTHDAVPRPRTPPLDGLIITILGGTGEQGRGLARRFAMAGHPVIIGSRSYNRARAAAQEVGHGICGLANRDAIREANLVIVAVPYEGHGELLAGLAAELAGKIVVDCVNPLGYDQGGAYPLPVPEGSAAQQAAALLPGSRVVAAFHTYQPFCCLTLRRKPLTRTSWCSATTGPPPTWCRRWPPGFRGYGAYTGGRLRNCRQIESLTANLVSINRRYKAQAGLRITDI